MSAVKTKRNASSQFHHIACNRPYKPDLTKMKIASINQSLEDILVYVCHCDKFIFHNTRTYSKHTHNTNIVYFFKSAIIVTVQGTKIKSIRIKPILFIYFCFFRFSAILF